MKFIYFSLIKILSNYSNKLWQVTHTLQCSGRKRLIRPISGQMMTKDITLIDDEYVQKCWR